MYADIPGAIAWLEKAFGFVTKVRIEDGEGTVVHCELEYGSGAVSLGGPTDAARPPSRLGGAYTSSLYVFVDDVDAHYERAKAAGARIVRELADQEYGDRTYGCEDLEGHLWYFGHRYDQALWDATLEAHNVAAKGGREGEGA
jgi:uncharacterized glyoxalase superfamily protein PhnB